MSDNGKLIAAIILSVVVLVVSQYIFSPKPTAKPLQTQKTAETAQPKAETPEQKQETGTGTADIFPEEKTSITPEQTLPEAVKENIEGAAVGDVTIDTHLYKAVFTTQGVGLKSFILKKYRDDKKQPMELISSKVSDDLGAYKLYPFYFSPFGEENRTVYKDVNTQKFKYEGSYNIDLTSGYNKSIELVFKYADTAKNILVVKRFTFFSDNYIIQYDGQVIKEGKPLESPFLFGPNLENNISKSRSLMDVLQIGYYNGEDVEKKDFAKLPTDKKFGDKVFTGHRNLSAECFWASYDTTYFAAVFKDPLKVNYGFIVLQNPPKNPLTRYSYIVVSKSQANPITLFMGPKDERVLSTLDETYGFRDARHVVSYGWFGPIARIMLKGIVLIYGLIPNYGWALVIFTILIKIILFPLTYASSVSMAKMQAVQPKINAIKKKYKNVRDIEQRKQMNTEIMALYKTEKINPAGGCLPMLLQLPILFAFFQLLPVAINFRHEPWIFWIHDLSMKDPYYILPILMAVTMLIVSKMTPTSSEGAQKIVVYLMPVMLLVFLKDSSAGLHLYWFVSNVLQMGQQYIINEKIYKEKKEEEKDRKAQKRKLGGKAL